MLLFVVGFEGGFGLSHIHDEVGVSSSEYNWSGTSDSVSDCIGGESLAGRARGGESISLFSYKGLSFGGS